MYLSSNFSSGPRVYFDSFGHKVWDEDELLAFAKREKRQGARNDLDPAHQLDDRMIERRFGIVPFYEPDAPVSQWAAMLSDLVRDSGD